MSLSLHPRPPRFRFPSLGTSVCEPGCRAGRMCKPLHRVATYAPISLPNIRPAGVVSRRDKDTERSLVRAFGEHHFIAFDECRFSRFIVHNFLTPRSCFPKHAMPMAEILVCSEAWT